MRSICLILFCLIISLGLSGNDTIRCEVWLNSEFSRMIKVVQHVDESCAEKYYYFTNTIPGTYEVMHYGDFIEGIKFIDAAGNQIMAKRIDKEKYEISNPDILRRIEYYVNDSWDELRIKRNYQVFCSRTNFERDTVYVLNNHAVFGYFKPDLDKPVVINVHKNSLLYPSTVMYKKHVTNSQDVLVAESYHNLFDSPVLYCIPDTVSFYHNGKKIITSCYINSELISAEYLQEHIVKPTIKAVSAHYNNFIPEEYWFIYYLFNEKDNVMSKYFSMAGDALEHKGCSFYVMEADYYNYLDTIVFDYDQIWIAVHELLHKIFPLTIRSSLVDNMSYYYDQMSRHLWLYEGVTEYLSIKTRFREGLITEEKFLEEMKYNIRETEKTKSDPLAVISENVLKKKYAEQYDLVYTKGALLAFLLDIELFTKSGGEYSIDHLIADLKDESWHSSFPEDTIYGYIKMKSGVDILSFFNTYIESETPIAYTDFFDKLGIRYGKKCIIPEYTFGSIADVTLYVTKDNTKDAHVEFKIKKSQVFQKGILKVLAIDDEIPDERNIDKILLPKDNTPVKLKYEEQGKILTKVVRPEEQESVDSYKMELDKSLENYMVFKKMMSK